MAANLVRPAAVFCGIRCCPDKTLRYIRWRVVGVSPQSKGILVLKLVFCGRGGNIAAHQDQVSCRCLFVG